MLKKLKEMFKNDNFGKLEFETPLVVTERDLVEPPRGVYTNLSCQISKEKTDEIVCKLYEDYFKIH